MRRVLIVANQTLGGNELQREIRHRAEAGDCDFWVLVPATRLSHLTTGIGAYLPSPPEARFGSDDGTARAETRLATELDRLREAGVKARGEIGDPDPIQAMRDTMATREFDEIILATLPQGVSRWLRQDLVHRTQRKFGLPVTHVESA